MKHMPAHVRIRSAEVEPLDIIFRIPQEAQMTILRHTFRYPQYGQRTTAGGFAYERCKLLKRVPKSTIDSNIVERVRIGNAAATHKKSEGSGWRTKVPFCRQQ